MPNSVRSGYADSMVEGSVPVGTTAIGNPLLIGAADGSGNAQYVGASNPLPVSGVAGAANIATSQVATSTAAATAAIARPTRRSVTIKNMDAAITVYVGPATVTSANGYPLLTKETVTLSWTGLIQVIAASGTPNIAVLDLYD